MYTAALYLDGRCVTGGNHGECACQLSGAEIDRCTSGFLDPETGRFVSDDRAMYLKTILCVRHGEENNERHLSRAGENQARAAGLMLVGLGAAGYGGFYSPAPRCQYTTEIIAAVTGIAFKKHPGLLECSGETHEEFDERLKRVLDELPEKAVLVTHSDVTVEITKLSTGRYESTWGVPHGSVTYLEAGKAVWVGKR